MFSPSNHLRFAEGFSIDLDKKILWFDGSRPEVPTKAVEVLCALVEEGGDVVTREDLLTKVWADAFVEEAVLTQNIYILRKVFKEHGIPQDLIETIPRRGYRFQGEPIEDSGEFETVTIERSFVGQAYVTEVSDEPIVRRANELQAPASSRFAVPLLSAALVVAVVAGVAAFYSFSTAGVEPEAERRAVVRYDPISASARALYAGLSPTNEYAAYVLHTPDNKYSLILHHIASKSEVEVVSPQERHLYSIQFSPDGKWIYFGGAKDDEKGSVYRIPTFGGTPEAITKRPIHHFSISPDGTRMAMYRRVPEESSHYLDICRIDAANDCETLVRMTNGSGFKLWGAAPSWSADGRKLLAAVFRPEDSGNRRRQYLAEINVADGAIREIETPDWHAVHQAYWSADGKQIFSMVRENAEDPVQLWRLDLASGSATRLTNDADDYREFRPSADGKFLVANTWLRAENLFLVSLEDPSDVRQLTFEDSVSNGANGLKWLSDAGRVIFSRANGYSATNLWQLNVDTLKMEQITFDKAAFVKSIDASEDGGTLYYASNRSGKMQIWQSQADGADPIQITRVDGDNAEVSPDGKWLYYSSSAGVWKIGPNDDVPTKVLDLSTGSIRVSPADEGLIAAFYFDPDERVESPWKFDIFREGQNDPVIRLKFRPVVFHWRNDGSGLYFVDNGETFSNVWFQPLDGGDPVRITNFSDQKISNFSVAADGRSMVLSRGVSTSRVVKIDLVG